MFWGALNKSDFMQDDVQIADVRGNGSSGRDVNGVAATAKFKTP